MSIYVYVTRKPDPLDEGDPVISADEWTRLVAADPDLKIVTPPGYSGTGIYAEWASFPGGYAAWFCLDDGNIEVKGIDDAILGKLRNFAQALDARIVSEEGEEFE